MSDKKNPRQIHLFMNNKVLLALQDNMQVETGENASAIHNSYSKIRMTLMDFSQGKGEKGKIVNANLDIGTVKYLAEKILRGDVLDYAESKILGYKKDDEGRSPVVHIQVKYCVNEAGEPLKSPWMVSVTNGSAIAFTTEIGGTAFKKETYKKINDVKVYMSEKDCYELFLTARDYIRNFEICHFLGLMKTRAAYEESIKEEKPNE